MRIEFRGHRKGYCDVDNDEGDTLISNINIDTANRIVACINACKDIENTELEQVSYGELLESHQYFQQQLNAPTVEREEWSIERLEEMHQQYVMNPELHATKQAYINALEYELEVALSAAPKE